MYAIRSYYVLAFALIACGQREESPVRSVADERETMNAGTRETLLAEGENVYRRACAVCHDLGISGAPKLGDRKAWEVRIPTGINILVRNSIDGYEGNLGVMPPRGGDKNLTDAEIEAAVRYMVELSK